MNTITIVSEDRPGVLYAIANIFLKRRINISKMHVEEIDRVNKLSRFVILLHVDPDVLHKVMGQIEKIVEVVEVEAVMAPAS